MSAQPILLAPSERRSATAALMLATAMQAADATIVNVALPQLQRSLGAGIELGTWVMTGYLVAAAIAVPLTGWLRRRLGTRRLYAAAVSLFVLASLFCALAPSVTAIIAFRILQGAGGGVIPALTQAVLHDLHPKERHGRMLSIWGAVTMLGPILGPALGGVITDMASWRWAFVLNLPLGIAAMWRMHRLLPQSETTSRTTLDVVGLLLLIAGIGALQLGLQRSLGHVWLRTEPVVEAAVVVVAFALLGLRISRFGSTMLRLDVFKDVNFAAAAFFNFATSGLLFTTIVFVPALAQGPLGYPATVAGLTIVPRGILMMLVVLGSGQLVGSLDFRILLVAGAGLMAAGFAVLTEVRLPDDLLWIVAGSTVQAMGAGMIMMPLSTYAFITLPQDRRTDAAGLYALLRQLGCAVGLALMSAMLQMQMSQHLAEFSATGAGGGTLQAYIDCFAVMALAALAIVPGVLLFRIERPHSAGAEAVAPGSE